MPLVKRHPSQLNKPPGAVSVDTDCVGCIHYKSGGTCTAYPKDIPTGIAYGYVRHDIVFPDQVGSDVFDPRPEFEVEWLDADGNPIALKAESRGEPPSS